jgi:hypothetical protein
MHNPTPLSLPPFNGAGSRPARLAANRTVTMGIEQIAVTVESAAEQREYFATIRDWADSNLASLGAALPA